jgi:hypothetical protein
MKRAGTICLAGIAVMLGACGSVDMCEEPEFYEFAEGGQRIVAPEDLDELTASREMIIPDASPRPPRPAGSGCLDRPPTLSLGEEDDEEDEEDEDDEEDEEGEEDDEES